MADLSDLQREWDSQPEYPEKKMNDIAELVRTRSGSMRSRLFTRDLTETIAGLVVIAVFGSYWFFITNPIARTGIAITIAGAVEIIILMQVVQRRGRADFTALPLKQFLLSEVQMLNRQIALLRHVAWWYLLPLYTGACIFVIGAVSDRGVGEAITFAATFCVGYFVFCVFVWWLNQKARKASLEPLRDAMQRTYDGLCALESEAGTSESSIAQVLTDPALDNKCQSVFLVCPSWGQAAVIVGACLAGTAAGLLIQYGSRQPIRFTEWPLAGLMLGGVGSIWATCVRRKSRDA